MWKRVVACAVLSLGANVPKAFAADILAAVMEDYRGQKTMHQQTTTGQNCDALLAEFRSLKDRKQRMQLTFQDPPFSGYVVDLSCIRPDGSVREP